MPSLQKLWSTSLGERHTNLVAYLPVPGMRPSLMVAGGSLWVSTFSPGWLYQLSLDCGAVRDYGGFAEWGSSGLFWDGEYLLAAGNRDFKVLRPASGPDCFTVTEEKAYPTILQPPVAFSRSTGELIGVDLSGSLVALPLHGAREPWRLRLSGRFRHLCGLTAQPDACVSLAFSMRKQGRTYDVDLLARKVIKKARTLDVFLGNILTHGGEPLALSRRGALHLRASVVDVLRDGKAIIPSPQLVDYCWFGESVFLIIANVEKAAADQNEEKRLLAAVNLNSKRVDTVWMDAATSVAASSGNGGCSVVSRSAGALTLWHFDEVWRHCHTLASACGEREAMVLAEGSTVWELSRCGVLSAYRIRS